MKAKLANAMWAVIGGALVLALWAFLAVMFLLVRYDVEVVSR